MQWSALVEPWGHLHDFGAALGAKWVTCGSVWVNLGGFAGSLGSIVLAGCMLWGLFGLFVCIHVGSFLDTLTNPAIISEGLGRSKSLDPDAIPKQPKHPVGTKWPQEGNLV